MIITGAGGNLGKVVTKKFLDGGFNVIATVNNLKVINDLPAHPNLDIVASDLTNEQEAHGMVEDAISKHRIIDAAVFLAGGYSSGGFKQLSQADLQKQLSLNFFTACLSAIPLFNHMMENNSGRIIFTGARPALISSAGKSMVAYALSKSLLFKLAEMMNAEAKGKNVTAAVIVPSTIDTADNRKNMPDADFDSWVKPAQIADLIEMICSERGSPLRETVLKIYGTG